MANLFLLSIHTSLATLSVSVSRPKYLAVPPTKKLRAGEEDQMPSVIGEAFNNLSFSLQRAETHAKDKLGKGHFQPSSDVSQYGEKGEDCKKVPQPLKPREMKAI